MFVGVCSKPQWTVRLHEQWPQAFKALDTHTGVYTIGDKVTMRTGPEVQPDWRLQTQWAVETFIHPHSPETPVWVSRGLKKQEKPDALKTERFRTSFKWPLGFWSWLWYVVWSGFAAALHTLNCGLLWPQIIKEGLRVLEKSQWYAS